MCCSREGFLLILLCPSDSALSNDAGFPPLGVKARRRSYGRDSTGKTVSVEGARAQTGAAKRAQSTMKTLAPVSDRTRWAGVSPSATRQLMPAESMHAGVPS